MAQVVEHLSSKHKALSSNLSTEKERCMQLWLIIENLGTYPRKKKIYVHSERHAQNSDDIKNIEEIRVFMITQTVTN
jgi:hypothetical protein